VDRQGLREPRRAKRVIAGQDWAAGGTQERVMAQSKQTKGWSAEVTAHSDALDLEPHVFSKEDPAEIAESLKRSAESSDRRKSSAFRSAMSMLNLYINRAGRNLPPD
jgi:hypothetical protein